MIKTITRFLGIGALLSPTIAQGQLQNGLLNYWQFEDDAVDVAATTPGASSTSADDGQINGTINFIDNATAALGAGFGKAAEFPGGGGNNITIADPDIADPALPATNDIDRSGADLTISLWFKLNNRDNNWQAIIAHGEAADYRVAMRGGNLPLRYAYAGGGASSDIVTSSSYGATVTGDGVWHHLVATTEGSVTTLYIDGVQEATGGTGPIAENGQNLLCIGCNPENGREWNGLLDDIAMWDRALSATEVTDIYNAGIAGNALDSLLDASDLDADGLPDVWETNFGLSTSDDGSVNVDNGPAGDPDMDNISNLDELANGTAPNNADTDDDDLNDDVEGSLGTNPLVKDTDGDGLEDGEEELVIGSDPTLLDTDSDTMPDGYEVTNLLDPNTDDSTLDADSDNLDNLTEFTLGTDPQNVDSDSDTSNDDIEVGLGTDPLDDDSDNDTILDGYETNNGTNSFVSATNTGTDPLVGDTDGDGTGDGAEVLANRDPTVPDSGASGLGERLVAYWNFDNNLNDIAHTLPGESLVADDGVFTGPATDVFYAASGLFGSSALEQNGGAGWVTVPSSIDTRREAENAVTVSAWIKVPAFTVNWQGVVSHGEGNQWRLARHNGNDTVAWAGGAGDINAAGLALADDAWHHVVGVSDPVNFITYLYVDGVEVTSGNAPTITDVNSGIIPDLFIGANPQAANREFNGQIDDLAIWGRALTAAEVSSIYNGGAGESIEVLLGGGTSLAITDILYNPNGGSPQIDLTWNSSANVSYGIYYSADLIDWTGVVQENITGLSGSTTQSFALPVGGAQKLFFRVEPTR